MKKRVFFKLFLPNSMKKLFLPIIIAIIFTSCRDKKTDFVPQQNPFDVFPTHFQKKVLLENFVSETDENTIQNNQLINQLVDKYQSNLIVSNIHKQDWLETPYTNDIATMLGGLQSYGRAAVNRLVGENTVQHDDNFTLLQTVNWDYTIQRALNDTAKIALAIETQVDKKNIGSVQLHIAHKEAIEKDLRIGIYMIENNIQSLFQLGGDANFLHQHVMKSSLFDILGDTILLDTEYADGEIKTKTYQNIDLKLFHVNNLYLVAFIYNYDIDFRKMKIYNAIEVKMGGVKFWNQ